MLARAINLHLWHLVTRLLRAYERCHANDAKPTAQGVAARIRTLLESRTRLRYWMLTLERAPSEWSMLETGDGARPHTLAAITLVGWLCERLASVDHFDRRLDVMALRFFRERLHEDVGCYVDQHGRSVAQGAKVLVDGEVWDVATLSLRDRCFRLSRRGEQLTLLAAEMKARGTKLSDDARDEVPDGVRADADYYVRGQRLRAEAERTFREALNQQERRRRAEVAANVPVGASVGSDVQKRVNLMHAKRAAQRNLTTSAAKKSRFAVFKRR